MNPNGRAAQSGSAPHPGAHHLGYGAELHRPIRYGRGHAGSVDELSISPEMMGLIFSAFSWTYALAQVPGGMVLDRLGSRITYTLSLALWPFATLVHGLMSSVAGLLSARLALGLAEAPCFPTNSRILATWFPQSERARANSGYAVGQYIGLGFMIPVLTWITVAWGWRALFLIFGAIGLIYALVR